MLYIQNVLKLTNLFLVEPTTLYDCIYCIKLNFKQIFRGNYEHLTTDKIFLSEIKKISTKLLKRYFYYFHNYGGNNKVIFGTIRDKIEIIN
jgi:hypothetical protein